MALNVEKFAQEGIRFLNEVSQEIGIEDRETAWSIVWTVSHTLRDRIYPGEAVNVMAQLPMALKAVYARRLETCGFAQERYSNIR